MSQFFDSFFQHLDHVSPLHALLLIGAGMLLESTAVPVPSEFVLPIAGYLAGRGKFAPGVWGFLEVLAVVEMGSLTGTIISYAIGYYGGKPLVDRYGKYFLVTSERYDHAARWLSERGIWAVTLSRIVYGLRHVISLVAGGLRVRFSRFVLFSLIGFTIWNTAGVYLGYRFGEAVRRYLDKISYGMLGILVIAIIVLVVRQVRHRKANSDSPE